VPPHWPYAATTHPLGVDEVVVLTDEVVDVLEVVDVVSVVTGLVEVVVGLVEEPPPEELPSQEKSWGPRTIRSVRPPMGFESEKKVLPGMI
jgi:hypothetical protein